MGKRKEREKEKSLNSLKGISRKDFIKIGVGMLGEILIIIKEVQEIVLN